ncbi:hypothetical protein Tco_0847927 [Tanacetum coccineum]
MLDTVNVVVQLQFNKLREEAQAENGKFLKQIHSNIKAYEDSRIDFKAQVSKIMPKVEKYVTESLGDEVLARSSIQPQTSYDAAASFSEFELKKILIDKIEEKQSMNRSDIQKNLYNTLIELYNLRKGPLCFILGIVVTLREDVMDQDKQKCRKKPSCGSNRYMRRRSGKEESSKEATQKGSKSTSSSKGASLDLNQIIRQVSLLMQRSMVQRVDDLEEPHCIKSSLT